MLGTQVSLIYYGIAFDGEARAVELLHCRMATLILAPEPKILAAFGFILFVLLIKTFAMA